MADAEVLERLDRIVAILKIANAEAIDAASKRIRGDAVSAAVLEAVAAGPIGAGELRARVSKETGQSERTVARRVASLIAMGALDQSGSGPTVCYQSAGIA